MSKRKRKINVAMSIDFGGSMTKIIAGVPGGRWCSIAMEPEVLEIPVESIKGLRSDSYCQSRPKDRAWIELGNKAYAVGYLAR